MFHTIIIGLSALLLFFSLPATASVGRVLINHPESHDDARYEYPKKLLRRILEITSAQFGPAIVETSGMSMSRSRALTALIEGKQLHVMAEAPKPDWNERLLCVRIPIRKGIQGYRIFLTRDEHKAVLDSIASFEEFKALPTGSGSQWSTTRVMEEAGFNVIKGIDYEGLFGMLIRKRFITFGRGINEVFTEYDERRSKFNNLAIDERFALYIPLPTYFFVTPTQPQLKARIENGLNSLIHSGEFETIFHSEFGPLIERAQLDKRILFSIPNPNLTEDDPLEISHYWYKPVSP
jgi:hypothetical protein